MPSLDSPPEKPLLTHLSAYGGFGTSKKPEFDIHNKFFFDNMDGVLVIAHIRGGGEKGLNWHMDGRGDNR